MKTLIYQLFSLLILLGSYSYSQSSVALFNGKDLSGWTIHGDEKWYAEDGEIICESGPKKGYGYLSTLEHYDDFELSLEFKQEANGNSGVFFRSTLEGTKISGWQVEVAPPCKLEHNSSSCRGDHTGGIYESYGRGWLIKPGFEKDKLLKMGEWNSLLITVSGSKVITNLNGIKMIELTDEKIGKGKGSIALQIHDGGGIKVKWRNINLKVLK